jgi:hypothetical protein
MLFAINRLPKGSAQARAGRRIELDTKINTPSNSVFFCRRDADIRLTEIGGMNFLSKLKVQNVAKFCSTFTIFQII